VKESKVVPTVNKPSPSRMRHNHHNAARAHLADGFYATRLVLVELLLDGFPPLRRQSSKARADIALKVAREEPGRNKPERTQTNLKKRQ
jgi:hypothetical protein